MLWQILIVTQKSRREMLSQLLSVLHRQINALGLKRSGDVDVLISFLEPGGLFQIGDARQNLRERAVADYINFIDDDDWIARDYVSRIMDELKHSPDYVGFEVAGFHDYARTKPDFHTLTAGRWFETDKAFFRDISHINPMRRDLAMKIPMSGGFGEDNRWANEMRGRVNTERYIDKVMYYYLFRTHKADAMDAHHPFRLELIEKESPR